MTLDFFSSLLLLLAELFFEAELQQSEKISYKPVKLTEIDCTKNDGS
jgi:hypothetical protein